MKRVAVTTTADSVPRIAAPLIEHGLMPVMLPCIAISPAPPAVLAALRAEAAKADLIIVTSARAVRITWPDGGMPSTPVAAVGSATAGAVVEAGGTVKVLGSSGASGLVGDLDVTGMRIVFPHARAADPSTDAELERMGASVYAATAYETIPISPGDDKVDAAIFGSPSAVDGWLTRRPLDGLVIGAMGPTTASALRVRGVENPVVPATPGYAELVEALAERIKS